MDAQNKALMRHAAANGYVIDDRYLYIDEGISGRTAEKRPAFLSMIAQAKSKDGPFDVILVHKFDRFARSREDSVVYKSLLRRECGVRVISVTESMEDDRFSVILEAMLEAMAEYYSINLADEVKKGMTEKHLRGELQASPSFGYRAESNLLIPILEEAAIVREVFARFVAGDGYFKLARWLNGMGIATPRGNPFESRTVEYMIQNPVYVGKLRWNPAGRTRRDYDNANIVLADGRHQALIDPDTWAAAQRRVAEVKKQWRFHGHPAEWARDWIIGLIQCSACKNTMVFAAAPYLRCGGYAKGRCETSQFIKTDLMRKAILSQLRQDAESSVPLHFTVTDKNAQRDDLSVLEGHRDRIQKKIGRLREAFLNGVDTVEEYGERKRPLESEPSALTAQIAALQSKHRTEEEPGRLRPVLSEALASLESTAATAEEKYAASHNIIEKIIWDKANRILRIHYNLFFKRKPSLIGVWRT